MPKSAKICWAATGTLVLFFAWTCLMDYLKHNSSDSAPYWAFAAARAIEFLLPAILFAIAALIIQFRSRQKQK